MKSRLQNPFFILGLVLIWRILLLVFTLQPIPDVDAFAYDGGVVNFLLNYFVVFRAGSLTETGRGCDPAIGRDAPDHQQGQ